MEVSTFFARLLSAPKPAGPRPDSVSAFDDAWRGVVDTLSFPDERQLARGVSATDVPANLKHIVDALVYESNRTDEDTTGACLEYFLRHDVLATLERLCAPDRPRGVKAEVLRTVNNLVVLMPERFLVHNAVHRPLRRLLRSCVGDAPAEERIDGTARIVGAAAASSDAANDEIEEDLVDLMCILCSRMRAYPPLLLIFFHDRGWLVPHPSSGAPATPESMARTLSLSPRPPQRTLSPPRAPGARPPSPSAAAGATLAPSPSPLGVGSDAMSGSTRQQDATHFEFLLFSYLLRFVHREGRTGDFARAGLLFLFDIAFLTRDEEGGDNLAGTPGPDGIDPLQDARDALAEYILDGDFADVMAAGLGATYSILPRKLRVPSLAEQVDGPASSGGMVLGAKPKKGDADDDDDDDEVLLSTDVDVRAQLDLLIKLFGFVSDILYRCQTPQLLADPMAHTVSSAQVLGPAVADATLDALQTAFVDNVLYPSILECSSADGSAVAVLTYLDVILANLEDGPVLQRMLDVLMDASGAAPTFASPRKKSRKTGAMRYVPAAVLSADYATDARFTLRDLILDNLQSSSHESRAAALHLLQTLLSGHCRHVASSLLTAVRMPHATALALPTLPPPNSTWPTDGVLPLPANSGDVHLQEDEMYSALVPRLDDDAAGDGGVGVGLATYLTDAHAFMEVDGCWRASRVPLQFVSDDGKPALLRVGEYDADPLQHALVPSDPVVCALLTALAAWFTAPPDTNVALTGALAALVRCPNRSLAGWLLYDVRGRGAQHDAWAASGADDDAVSDTSFDAVPSMPTSRADDDNPFSGGAVRAPLPLPAVYQILRELVRHVGRFRGTVEGFDRLLAERRQGLLFADHLEEAMSAMLEDVASPPMPSSPAAKGSSPGFLGRGAGGERKKSAASGIASSIRSLWSPRKSRAATPASPAPAGSDAPTPPLPASATASPRVTSPTPPTPTTPGRASGAAATPQAVPGSLTAAQPDGLAKSPPFKTHYTASTGVIDVEPVSPVQTGPWAHSLRPASDASDASADDSDNDVEPSKPTNASTPAQATLSAVLDNCIVLEELIKELVAVIIVRRALGIDQVGFVSTKQGL